MRTKNVNLLTHKRARGLWPNGKVLIIIDILDSFPIARKY